MDFPPDEDEEAERRSPRECPEDVDENRVTPTAGGESEENHVTPTNTGGEPEETEENHVAPNTGTTSARAQSTDFTVVHPTQVRFTCPVCALTYPKHASLIRHVGVSHKSVNLNIKFKCALCDYTHANKRSTSLHFRHAHGVAIPPATIDGSKEKACPFCPLTFPSSHSCSTHIREKHMTEACQQRSREAAQKEAQQGVSTARTKWTQREIELFKAALAKYGPGSNIKLAKEIGTRSTEQVNVYKCRFLKAYPTWVSEHYHPAIPVDGTARSSATTRSPSSQPQVGHTPPGPSNTQGHRTAGPRALTVPTVNRRRGALPAFPTSPPSSPPDAAAAGQQLPTRSPTSTTPHQAVASARQHYSPGVVTAQPSQEERTPSPPPVPVSEGGVLRLQLLDQALTILRSNNISVWDPEASCFSPPATDLATPTSSSPLTTVPARMHCSPGMGGACQPQPPPATIPPAPAITPPPAPVTRRPSVTTLHLPVPPTRPAIRPGCPTYIHDDTTTGSGATIPERRGSRHLPPSHATISTSTRLTADCGLRKATLQPGGGRGHQPAATYVASCGRDQPANTTVVTWPLPPPAGVPGPPATITIDPERMDETLRMPMYQELTPFSGRRLGTFEWVAFEEGRGNRSGAAATLPTDLPPPGPGQPDSQNGDNTAGNRRYRTPGIARRANEARTIQRAYRTNPGNCMRRLLQPGPPVFCKIGDAELVEHFNAAYSVPPPLGPPPLWLFPPRHPESLQRTLGGQRDLLQGWTASPTQIGDGWIPRLDPGSHIQHLQAKQEDPYCMEAFHGDPDSQGGDVAIIQNWRTISLQLTIYKIYSALIARRIAAWAISNSAFPHPPTTHRARPQNFFLAYDGCAEHNFLLRSMFTDSRRKKKNLLLTWVNSLAYADDVCIAASSKEENQHLLDRAMEYVEWAGFAFNAKKCGSLCMINQAPRISVDHLYTPRLGTDVIPALSWEERYKYLGCPTGAFRSNAKVLEELRQSLVKDTDTVFQSPLAEWQKLDAFRRFLFPRLSFAMKVMFPGITWCKKLDTSLRSIIKRGLHLPRRTCTHYFYLSHDLGGLGIPSAEMESHAVKAGQAFKFLADTRDPYIRAVALDQLTDTVKKRARHLDPNKPEDLSEFLNNSAPPGEGGAGDMQSIWSQSSVLDKAEPDSPSPETGHEAASSEWTQKIHGPRPFDSVAQHPDSTFFTYTGAFLTFPQYRFIHKARLNLLPDCAAVPPSLGTKYKEQAIPGTTGNNRPDLTIISPDESTVTIVDVSCPFEGSPLALEEAAKTKLMKYEPLKQHLLQTYNSVTILPFIVGSLGSWYPANDRVLSSLRIGRKYASLMRKLCVVSAVAGSQNIWYASMCTHRRSSATATEESPEPAPLQQ
eukprot:Em0007g1125a